MTVHYCSYVLEEIATPIFWDWKCFLVIECLLSPTYRECTMYLNYFFLTLGLSSSSSLLPLWSIYWLEPSTLSFSQTAALGESGPSVCACGSEKKWHQGHAVWCEVGKGQHLSNFQLLRTGASQALGVNSSAATWRGFSLSRDLVNSILTFLNVSPSRAVLILQGHLLFDTSLMTSPVPTLDRISHSFLCILKLLGTYTFCCSKYQITF